MIVLKRCGAALALLLGFAGAWGSIRREPAAPPEETHLLGLALSPLSAELRQRFGIDERVKRGVVIMGAEANTPAAKNDLMPGPRPRRPSRSRPAASRAAAPCC